MKKIILSAALIVFAGLSSAHAQNQTDINQEELQNDVVIQPYYRNCDSPYLGNNETCISNSKNCPGGYEASQANYCCDGHGNFYRCGTVCKSIYVGGH